MQGDADSPKAPLGNNVRPAQPLNQRFIRTNIDFRRKQVSYLTPFITFIHLPDDQTSLMIIRNF